MDERKLNDSQQVKLAERCRKALEKSYGMPVPMPKRGSKSQAVFEKGRKIGA
jgi:hypothetical protein